MNRHALFLLASVALLSPGCIPIDHYRVRAGTVELVHWDEGNGTQYDPVPQADVATFKQFPNCAYATDRNHVFFDGKILPGADPATFHRLQDYYWRDKSRVYYFGKLVPGADPNSFRYLGYDIWWRDNHNIYVQDTPVNPKDLATFQILNANWARDSKWYYPIFVDYYTPIEKLDYPSFRILRNGWAVDRTRAYYYNTPVNVADLKSFRAIDEDFACDNYWCYDSAFKRIPLQEARDRGIIK